MSMSLLDSYFNKSRRQSRNLSFLSDSPWRGCASCFSQPVQEDDIHAARTLVETVHYFNCRVRDPPSPDIIYRSSDGERDILHHVFHWDVTPYQQAFQNGFHAWRQEDIPEETFFDLNDYVHHGGRPLDSTRPATHAFVSATLDRDWRPTPTLQPGEQIRAYRYEIYAPGGIWVAQTLVNLYQNPAQDEVCFVAGIAPQYIRSAQLFFATCDAESMSVGWRSADNILIINGHFNPQSHPSKLLTIQKPVFDYAENGTNLPLRISIYKNQLPPSESKGWREKRQVPNDTSYWYAGKVADRPNYITAAFRSSRKHEAYIFMKNEYVLMNYAPGSTGDRILSEPLLICDGFKSLIGTAFGEHGIDCAFDIHIGSTAYIFSGNLCAYIDYAPGTTNDKILEGPVTITAMFRFFKGTVFADGIDSAFRATATNEVYLFKGDQYALINYGLKKLNVIQSISKGFHSLSNTVFAKGIDAAFASHRKDQAYIFKGDKYALFKFAHRVTKNRIVGGVKPILPNWPSLARSSISSRKNRGLEVHSHRNQAQLD